VPNLYAILGIGRDATKHTIRKAYRKVAKQAHPDAGGDANKFALVKLAHDVLMDDKRRQIFDETGTIDENFVDNSLGDGMQWVNIALDQVLEVCTKRNLNPVEVDLISDCSRFLRERKGELDTANKALTRGVALTKKLVGRFKAKGSKPNRMEAMIAGRISALEQGKARNKSSIDAIDLALAMLADHTFDWSSAGSYSTGGGYTEMLNQLGF